MDLEYIHAGRSLLIHNAHERIWSKIDRKGPDDCWLWLGSSVVHNGDMIYGCLIERVGPRHLNKHLKIPSHRLVYWLEHGPIPDGLVVRHRCTEFGHSNDGRCCNPRHLRVGTHADNAADKVVDGTSTTGEKNPTSYLTVEQVLDIRLLRDEGLQLKILAEKFETTHGNIDRIVRGLTWKNAGGPIQPSRHHRRCLTIKSPKLVA